MNLPSQTALARYGAVKVTTASPGQILVMLYDGLLRFLKEADAAMVAKQRARSGERMSRSHAILRQLLGGLDRRHSPDLCNKLQALYLFCVNHLLAANIEQNPQKIRDIVKILTPLRDAWATAVAEVAAAERESEAQ